MNGRRWCLLAGVILVGSLPSLTSPVQADQTLITLQVVGTVDLIEGVVPNGFALGDAFTITYEFDSSVLNSSAQPGYAIYNAPTSVVAQIGSYQVTGTDGQIYVQNDIVGAAQLSESYSAYFLPLTGAPLGSAEPSLLSLNIQNNNSDGTIFADDSLPTTALDLASFPTRFLVLEFDDPTCTDGPGPGCPPLVVTATVDSMTVVDGDPDPTLITFQVVGTVEVIEGVEPEGFALGSEFSITYEFNSSIPDRWAPTGYAIYDAPTSVVAQIGSYQVTGMTGTITIQKDALDGSGNPLMESYSADFAPLTGAPLAGAPSGSAVPSLLSLSIQSGNSDGSLLADESMPTTALDVTLFPNRWLVLEYDDPTCTNNGPIVCPTQYVIASVDSMTVIDGDGDGDGVADSIDTGAAVFVDGTVTYGEILDTGGLSVLVTDAADPDGVRIVASGLGGPAELAVCGFTLSLSAGSDATITCGSVTVDVAAGEVTVSLDSGDHVTIPVSGSATVDRLGDGTYTIDNFGTTEVEVTLDGMTTTVDSGDTVEFPPDGDGDGVPDLSDNCPTIDNSDQTDFDGDGLGDVCDDATDMRLVKAELVDDLHVLAVGASRRDSNEIHVAIDEINRSLDSKLWTSTSTLDPEEGHKVFDHEAKAVNALAALVQEASPLATQVQVVIDTLVEGDRRLAAEAIVTAIASGGDLRDITKAGKDIAKGDAERDAGKPDNAIKHYKDAWKDATKAHK